MANRTKAVPPRCFNYFQFAAGGDAFEVRAYGDQHIEATLNGVDVSLLGESAAGFEPSPNLAEPHSIFEFRLPLSNPDAFRMSLCDPTETTFPPPELSVDPSSGCDSVAKLLEEPHVVRAAIAASGDVTPTFVPAGQPSALGLSAYRSTAGDSLTLDGRELGSAAGDVYLGERRVVVTAWSDRQVAFVVPRGIDGIQPVKLLTAARASAEPLFVDVSAGPACTPTCGEKACGDDGCGGRCDACPDGQTCAGGDECVPAPTPG